MKSSAVTSALIPCWLSVASAGLLPGKQVSMTELVDRLLRDPDHVEVDDRGEPLPRALVASLRAELGDVMYAYNITSGLWDWVSLGLDDVLRALQGHLAGERFRLPSSAFAAFYCRAMEIAVRAEPAPPRLSD